MGELKSPPFQFVPITSWPVIGHHPEEPGSTFFSPSVVHTHEEDPSEPSLLQAEQSQLSHLLHVIQMLQALQHFCDPFLDSLQYIHIPLTPGSPRLDSALQL